MENNTRIHISKDGQKCMITQTKDKNGNFKVQIIKVKEPKQVEENLKHVEQEGDNNEF